MEYFIPSNRTLAGLLLVLVGLTSCTTSLIKRELVEVENAKSISQKNMYVKVHMADGKLYVLHSWRIDETAREIHGYGNYLDANRTIIESKGSDFRNKKINAPLPAADFTIPFSGIVLLETNDKGTNPAVPMLIVSGIATGAFAVYCAINPKACFGSCPTFYVDHGDSLKLVAEGFSSSISKSMEETDVDMLYDEIAPGQREFFVTVKNEALETHMIKGIRLILLPKTPGVRVLREGDNTFYEVHDFQVPARAYSDTTPILSAVKAADTIEWFSPADAANLLTQEEINLEFDNPGMESGLVIAKRQSLMTTFLFYHSLSLLGNAAGYFYSKMETGNQWVRERSLKMYDLLGGINVLYRDDHGTWRSVSEINEQGPIAEDFDLIRLPKVSGKKIFVKLQMTKGLWRINCLNLVTIGKQRMPVSLDPVAVSRGLAEDSSALDRLLSRKDYLVTFPRDEYRMKFIIPSHETYEYFIESEGYYIEWMREEWLPHQDLQAARALFRSPRNYLKAMAPLYKGQEPEMERVFWNSRYTK